MMSNALLRPRGRWRPSLLRLLSILAVAPCVYAIETVNCHDVDRDLVRAQRADQCQGRIVTDAEAEAIRARRREYVGQALRGAARSSVSGQRLASIGSGFFVGRDGSLLTNFHVIKDCTTLLVAAAAGSTGSARVRAARAGIDLALLQASGPAPGHAIFAPAGAPPPDALAIVGYPNQGIAPLYPLLTRGRLLQAAPTALATPAPAPSPRPLLLQADIRPGHSGGPALDGYGRVVGVVFAAVDTPGIYRRTGRLIRDIGVAVPNDLVLAFLARQGISPDVATPSAAPDDLLAFARPMMARVECWK